MKLSLNTDLLDDFSNTDLLLLDYLAKSTKNGQPSNSTIQRELRLSVNTILKSLDKLQKRGLVLVDNPSRTVRIISVTDKGNDARKTSAEVVSHELSEEQQKIVDEELSVKDEFSGVMDYNILQDDLMVQWGVKALYENIERLMKSTVRDSFFMKQNGIMFARVEMLFDRLELGQRLHENYDVDKKIYLLKDLFNLTAEVQKVAYFNVNDIATARKLLVRIEKAVEG